MPASVLASSVFRSFPLAGFVLVAAGCASSATIPNVAKTAPIGYATDSTGDVAHGGGGCVRTGSWDPRYAIPECDPDLVAKAQPAPSEPEQQPEAEAKAPEAAPEAPELNAPGLAAAGAAGAMAAAAEPEPEPAKEPTPLYVGADTYFAFDRSDLTEQGRHALDVIADRASKLESVSIRVVGYADQIGTEEYNLALSQRRADAVRTYLVEHGVSEEALNIDAQGEADPIVG
ncbi:MAG: OmpA family protein, partial [Sulfurifustis sp.]